jgi:hypothetical protein
MLSFKKKMGLALFSAPLVLIIAGCACGRSHICRKAAAAPVPSRVAELLPPDAKEGECYMKVFIPEKFETSKETVCVREASERLEIVPARYEWVEEKILVKDASTVLVEVPAEYTWQEQNVQTEAGHTGWHVKDATPFAGNQRNLASPQMFCLVSHQPRFQTVKTQVVAKPATTREEIIPAEYQTVRRQKLISPATTRRITIPAEFATVDVVRKVADSRVEWQRVDCEIEGGPGDTTIIRDSITMGD